MAGFITSIFATHHPNWADIPALLNILIVDERWLVINRANKEAQVSTKRILMGPPQASWGNCLDRAPLERKWRGEASLPGTLQKVHAGRAEEGVPPQKSLNRTLAVPQGLHGDASEILERTY